MYAVGWGECPGQGTLGWSLTVTNLDLVMVGTKKTITDPHEPGYIKDGQRLVVAQEQPQPYNCSFS